MKVTSFSSAMPIQANTNFTSKTPSASMSSASIATTAPKLSNILTAAKVILTQFANSGFVQSLKKCCGC